MHINMIEGVINTQISGNIFTRQKYFPHVQGRVDVIDYARQWYKTNRWSRIIAHSLWNYRKDELFSLFLFKPSTNSLAISLLSKYRYVRGELILIYE